MGVKSCRTLSAVVGYGVCAASGAELLEDFEQRRDVMPPLRCYRNGRCVANGLQGAWRRQKDQ